jgi:hypothetical protein
MKRYLELVEDEEFTGKLFSCRLSKTTCIITFHSPEVTISTYGVSPEMQERKIVIARNTTPTPGNLYSEVFWHVFGAKGTYHLRLCQIPVVGEGRVLPHMYTNLLHNGNITAIEIPEQTLDKMLMELQTIRTDIPTIEEI